MIRTSFILTTGLFALFLLVATPNTASAMVGDSSSGRPSYEERVMFQKRFIRNPANRDRRLADVPAVQKFYEQQ